MQYTPNYNLITVEGTDVVNPLVQMNPNFTDIDAAMFANKQAVIGSATEITSGTVHSITRANPDSNYFRFTATSNWTAGDSMSVDGVSVSVYLTDGTLPESGSYVINSEVFGMISGTRVTLFVNNSMSGIIGNLSDLETSDKSSIVNAINEVYDIATLIESVSVTADGTKTYAQMLSDLYAASDTSKLNSKSTLVITSGSTRFIYNVTTIASTFCQFELTRLTPTAVYVEQMLLGSSNEYLISSNGTITDNSTSVPTAGRGFTIIY